jgi:hypothetical protein
MAHLSILYHLFRHLQDNFFSFTKSQILKRNPFLSPALFPFHLYAYILINKFHIVMLMRFLVGEDKNTLVATLILSLTPQCWWWTQDLGCMLGKCFTTDLYPQHPNLFLFYFYFEDIIQCLINIHNQIINLIIMIIIKIPLLVGQL